MKGLNIRQKTQIADSSTDGDMQGTSARTASSRKEADMRLWHKDLIPVLPRQQLLGQWRECCLIAKNIAENGTPNHLLVNKVMDYPIEHFWSYAGKVAIEMQKRGYKYDLAKFSKYFEDASVCWEHIPFEYELFMTWHNERYLMQCYYNLQEKYDCGGITDDEWMLIDQFVKSREAQNGKDL